jgi:hypothetical protein
MILYSQRDSVEWRSLPVLMTIDEPSLWENGHHVLRTVFERLAERGCRYLVCFGARSLEAVAAAKVVFHETFIDLEVRPLPGLVFLALGSLCVEDARVQFMRHTSSHFAAGIVVLEPAALAIAARPSEDV